MGLLVMEKHYNSRKEMEADAKREDRALSRKAKSKALEKKADRAQARHHKSFKESQKVKEDAGHWSIMR